MRLIDAETVKEAIESHTVSMTSCLTMDEHFGMTVMKEQCLEDVDNAPAVDAIPVEWLREQIDKYDVEGAAAIRWLIHTWQEGKHETD